METETRIPVAVLLATYNGAQFVGQQIASLAGNSTPFTLHWLDDHSTDDTRNSVRTSAQDAGVRLREWRSPEHLGVPGSFFHLIECVDAEVYLFCDQDDIWQPGKIDATVDDLLPDVSLPVLCFSDPLTFRNDKPEVLQRLSDVRDVKPPAALDESRLFTSTPAWGHTIGFTQRLREIFLSHKEIAQAHASMHDWWLYLIALATGTARVLLDAPTTLYRRHDNNLSEIYFRPRGLMQAATTWRIQQGFRKMISRQAEGFLLASATLPPGPKLERLLDLAKLIARIDKRQSPFDLIRLARLGAMDASSRRAAWLTAACLCSDARP